MTWRQITWWTTLAVLALLAGLTLHHQWIVVPPQWLPWRTLVVADPPNFWTRHKLSRLTTDAAACRAVLATTAVEYEVLTDRITGENCGFQDAVLVQRMPGEVTEPFC